MRKIITICVVSVMVLGLFTPAFTARAEGEAGADWEYAMNRALTFLRNEAQPNPMPGSVGSDWTVISLARAGWADVGDPWVQAWLGNMEQIYAGPGPFPGRWSMMDFQRVTLVLTALGVDATDFFGNDLTAPFAAFVPVAQRPVHSRTINASIFALIALRAGLYEGDEGDYIGFVLNAQRADGSWGLNPDAPSTAGDMSITAMAVQALAPHYAFYGPAREAVRRGLAWANNHVANNPECLSQLIIALAALAGEHENIYAMAAVVGESEDYGVRASAYVQLLLTWFDPVSGGFRRPLPTDPVNLMATEQAALALVAYWRLVNEKTPLYAMGDVELSVLLPVATESGFVFHPDVSRREVVAPGTTFGDIRGHENQQAIEALLQRGIIGGWCITRFAPNERMTRAEFTAVITSALGLPLQWVGVFTDIPEGTSQRAYIDTAFFYGIVSGTSATTFNPNGNITRQDAAVMLTRAANLVGLDADMGDVEVLNILAMFGDYRRASARTWPSLAFSFREGILCDEVFYIRPLDAITRGEASEMVYGLLTRVGLI